MIIIHKISQAQISVSLGPQGGHGMRQVKHQPGIAGPRRSHKGPAETSFVVRCGPFKREHNGGRNVG